MKQYKPLKVKYIGKSGKEIELMIEDFPDDQELIIAMTDSTYQAEWKTELLDSYYEENLNNRRESRSDRHSQLSTFKYESAEIFGVEDDIEEKLLVQEWMDDLAQVLSERQRYLIQRCILDGEGYSSIAREEGKDESAIRKAVNRAKTKLKKYFQDRPN